MIEVLVEGKTYQSAFFCFAYVIADIGWVTHASVRARKLLSRKTKKTKSLEEGVFNSLISWMKKKGIHEVMLSSVNHDKKKIVERILKDQISGFKYKENELMVDEIVAFGTTNVSDTDIYQHLYDVAAYIQFDDIEKVPETKKSIKKKRKIAEGQLAMNLFDFWKNVKNKEEFNKKIKH